MQLINKIGNDKNIFSREILIQTYVILAKLKCN